MSQPKQGLLKPQQTLTQATINYNKSISSIKQTTLIRKIAIESLSPIIKKIQQHISNLLQQTTYMRLQRKQIEQTHSTNQIYKQEIHQLKNKMYQIRTEMHQLDQQHRLYNKDNDKKLLDFQYDTHALKQQSTAKNQKIKHIVQMIESQTQLFSITKHNISQTIDYLKEQIKQFYSKSLQQSIQKDNKQTKLEQNLSKQSKSLSIIKNQLSQMKKLTTLYQAQRDEIRNYLHQFAENKNFTILREQYQKDKKIHKIQNQMLKKDIEKALNDALTPQIRKFLPNLIHNIELLKKIQKQIKNTQQQIQVSRIKQIELSQKINDNKSLTQSEISQRQIICQKLETQQNNNYLQLCSLVKQKSSQLLQLKQTVLTAKQQTKLKFQTFIQTNKLSLYQAVLSSKPTQLKQQEDRLRQRILGFQQQIQSIQKQLFTKCDNVITLGQGLQAKLELFQNRITKAKSDLKVENDNIKKILQNYGHKMNQADAKNHQQSQTISKIIQILLINTALLIDEDYLREPGKYNQSKNQTFISFHDGVIFQLTNDASLRKHEVVYRKKLINKQILKRSTLKEAALLIDHITQKLKNWKWMDSKQRPSQYFSQHIYPSYETLLKQKSQLIQAKRMYLNLEPNLKLPSSRLMSPNRSKQTLIPKGSSSRLENTILKNKQKSIDKNSSIERGVVSSLQKHDLEENQNLYQTLDFKKPNRIQLKKIDQKAQSNRYSVSVNKS